MSKSKNKKTFGINLERIQATQNVNVYEYVLILSDKIFLINREIKWLKGEKYRRTSEEARNLVREHIEKLVDERETYLKRLFRFTNEAGVK